MGSDQGLEIKTRMRSVEETRKITKAMGLVASAKIAKAKERIQHSRPYFQILNETLNAITYSEKEIKSPYLMQNESEYTCIVVLGGDRGLAGGYNHNLFRKAEEVSKNKKFKILPIGKKVLEYYERKNANIISRSYGVTENMTVGQCFEISWKLCDLYLKEKFKEVILVYTQFISMMEQSPVDMKVLPLSIQSDVEPPAHLFLYEPNGEEVYNAIVPEYFAGVLYGALCEAQASEHGARHTAMDSASRNAEDMLDTLNLQFNRVRQGSITQEITEIISGLGG